MSIGERIRALRKEKKLSMMKIREITGLSKSTISDIENNNSSPSVDTLNKLAKAMNVSVDEFFKEQPHQVSEAPVLISKRPNNLISTDKITEALGPDIELLDFWNELKERPNLQLLFKQTRTLEEKDIRQVLRVIKAMQDEEDAND